MIIGYYNGKFYDFDGKEKKIHQGKDGSLYIIREKLINDKILKFKVTLEEIYEKELGFSGDAAYRAVYGRDKSVKEANNEEHEYHYPNIEERDRQIEENVQQNQQMSDSTMQKMNAESTDQQNQQVERIVQQKLNGSDFDYPQIGQNAHHIGQNLQRNQQMSDAERQQMSDAERQEKNNINVESKNAQPQQKVENIVENNPVGSKEILNYNYPMQQHYNIQNQQLKPKIQEKKINTKEKFNNTRKLSKSTKLEEITTIRMPVMEGEKRNDNNLLGQLSFIKQFFGQHKRIRQMINYINAVNRVNHHRKSQKIKSCAEYYVKLGKQSCAEYYVKLGKQQKSQPLKLAAYKQFVM